MARPRHRMLCRMSFKDASHRIRACVESVQAPRSRGRAALGRWVRVLRYLRPSVREEPRLKSLAIESRVPRRHRSGSRSPLGKKENRQRTIVCQVADTVHNDRRHHRRVDDSSRIADDVVKIEHLREYCQRETHYLVVRNLNFFSRWRKKKCCRTGGSQRRRERQLR